MNHVDKSRQNGFTLIELVLAMTFISVLLLAIAMTIIQIGTMYNRGMTLKETNETARTISDDFERNVSASEAFSLTTDMHTSTAGGRVCLGNFTYLWNLGKVEKTGDTNIIKYLDPAKASTPVRFIKIADPAKLYCARNASDALIQKDIPASASDQVQELLKAGDKDLALHMFTITSGTNSADTLTGQQLYRLNFSIGTNNIAAMNPDQTACLPPSEIASDFVYCSVQQFNLVVRAGNRIN